MITGTNFAGATDVSIGGVSQTFTANSATQITINPVTDAVPLDTRVLAVTTPGGTANFNVVVVHLVITEIDVAENSHDDHELIEVRTGLSRSVTLTGYRVANIDAADNPNKTKKIDPGKDIDLGSAATSATGYFVAAPSESGYTRQFTFNRTQVDDGPGALAIFQTNTLIADNTVVTSITGNIIDVVVYTTNDSDDVGLNNLLNLFYGTNTLDLRRTSTNEGADNNSGSISRCNSSTSASPPYTSNDRMDGRVFKATATETPGAANNCN